MDLIKKKNLHYSTTKYSKQRTSTNNAWQILKFLDYVLRIDGMEKLIIQEKVQGKKERKKG